MGIVQDRRHSISGHKLRVVYNPFREFAPIHEISFKSAQARLLAVTLHKTLRVVLTFLASYFFSTAMTEDHLTFVRAVSFVISWA